MPIKTQGLFTDGWLMTLGKCANAKDLHRFLRSWELDVAMPISVGREGRFWVHLEDGCQVLDHTL